MSDIYFLRVTGDGQKELAETLLQKTQNMDTASDDNIVIVPENIEPLSRGEAKAYLRSMADALDVEIKDESS